MSDPGNPSAASADLQFESAEPAAGTATALVCTGCSRPIGDSYHQVNGQVVCAPCRAAVEGHAKTGGFGRALVLGAGAAAAGWAVYFAILKLTRIEFGLIAILVGYVVGRAVSSGSGARGGWLYQVLAVGLTYLAIVCTYVPLIAEAFREQDAAMPAAAVYVGSFITALISPALMVTESPIGLIIIAVGLYQAWKLNQRAELDISGPYAVAAREAQPSLHVAAG